MALFQRCFRRIRKSVQCISSPHEDSKVDDIESRGLSMFEQLPRELVWKIIENVHEGVFELRLTSQLIRSYVDDYALQNATIPLVDHLVISASRFPTILLCIAVVRERSPLFELKLRLHGHNGEFLRRNDQVANRPNQYVLSFDAVEAYRHFAIYGDDGRFEYLRRSIGGEIETLTMIACDEWRIIDGASHQMNSIKIKQLIVEGDTFSDKLAAQIISSVEKHAIELVSLEFNYNDSSDPVAFLLQLSSLVRSIRLWPNDCFIRVESQDFGQIILEMFSRKLDKLLLMGSYGKCISVQCLDALKEKLPLIGKKAWLTVNCNEFQITDEFSHTHHDHLIKVTESELEIKHIDRKYESFGA